jgi:hypothetical protein
LPHKEPSRGTDKQPPPPQPPKAEDACTKFERLFQAALASNDFKTAASILVDANDCPFAKTRLHALQHKFYENWSTETFRRKEPKKWAGCYKE